MFDIGSFNPNERRREKQRSREQDDRDLREGRVSRDELRSVNGVFSGVNLAGSSVRRRERVRA